MSFRRTLLMFAFGVALVPSVLATCSLLGRGHPAEREGRPDPSEVTGPGVEWVGCANESYPYGAHSRLLKAPEIVPVLAGAEEKAVVELDARRVVELKGERVRLYSGRDLPPGPVRAFLVRGVAYEGDPLQNRVAWYWSDGLLQIHEGVNLRLRLLKRPRVVFISEEITRVCIRFAIPV